MAFPVYITFNKLPGMTAYAVSRYSFFRTLKL